MRRAGVTLLEVLTAVAVLGLLASVVVPNYVSMQHRSKRAELAPNVESIRQMELAFEAAHAGWVSEQTPRPDASPGRAPRSWIPGTRFDVLGWAPEGQVLGSYRVEGDGDALLVTGFADVDGDGDRSLVTATREAAARLTSAEGVY